jgi:hypothetical protein
MLIPPLAFTAALTPLMAAALIVVEPRSCALAAVVLPLKVYDVPSAPVIDKPLRLTAASRAHRWR